MRIALLALAIAVFWQQNSWSQAVKFHLPTKNVVASSVANDVGAPIVTVGQNTIPTSSISQFSFESAGNCHHCSQPYCGRTCCGHSRFDVRARMQQKLSEWAYPHAHCERPFGSYMRAQLETQIRNGAEAQLAFYRYDFFQPPHTRADSLSPAGLRRLDRVISLLQSTTADVLVQSTGNATRDAHRRESVIQAITQAIGGVEESRVKSFARDRHGMLGAEAAQNHGKMIRKPTTQGSQAMPGLLPGLPNPFGF